MTFEALREELDRWSALGRRATLWWRDDDAATDTPALRRLLSIADSHDVPLGLAVVPAALSDDALPVIVGCRGCVVMQHGYAHRNHAPPAEKRSELGTHRPVTIVMDELAQGRDRLCASFGPQFAPLLVPPWNRIAPEVTAALPARGYRGLSTFGPRRDAMPSRELVQCNTHVDLVAWKSARSFVGDAVASERLAAHLAARRESRADADEPTGILTHHLDFDAQAWAFVERLLAFTRVHRDVQWITPRAAFAVPPGVPTSFRSA